MTIPKRFSQGVRPMEPTLASSPSMKRRSPRFFLGFFFFTSGAADLPIDAVGPGKVGAGAALAGAALAGAALAGAALGLGAAFSQIQGGQSAGAPEGGD